MFITFEGGEGSGKSVQSCLLAERLQAQGFKVVLTREPGGTIGAEAIRQLLLTGAADLWDALSEALLYQAARADHWFKVIKPALDRKEIVISDRFQDSTLIYQGICRGAPIDLLEFIYNKITGGIYPDRTYFLSIDPKEGLRRSLSRTGNSETRFEKMDLEFHQKVLEAFKTLASKSKRFLSLDGSLPVSALHNQIFLDFEQLLPSC